MNDDGRGRYDDWQTETARTARLPRLEGTADAPGAHAAPSRRRPSRRALLGLGAAGLLAGGASLAAARWGGHSASALQGVDGSEGASAKPIGDGSTSDTGAQPHRQKPRRLAPGERPPQFVVVSWDGAGSLDDGLFERFRGVAKDTGAHMTFFLSGLYLLPESKKHLYRPPNNPVGASDIGYLADGHIRNTIEQVSAAWREGHEIGTHFNGHFCSGSGSVAKWTPEMWESEISQAMSFVTSWKTNTGFTDLPALPFDYREELVGGRTPCLLGQDNLLVAAAARKWRYDASSPGGLQVWPTKKHGLWDFPLQSVPFPGHHFEVLTMDYNMMANQSGNSTNGNTASRPGWLDTAHRSYKAGFQRAYDGNRAPMFVGNHFESWNGGIYMDAVEKFVRDVADMPDVRFVSFRELCDWLDAQSADTLASFRTLGVGQAPSGGWDGLADAA
ncbi:hypothetical protein [Streptomyces sp. NPDC050560]|uniref:hypothetical protein n=1 Tax=Streptomyces sp. NPDC050560 TaxID=3365630 RepID=UPI00378B60E8